MISGVATNSYIAPLSATQTQQIAAHLQDQISSLQESHKHLVEDIVNDVRKQIQFARAEIKEANERSQNMQDRVKELSAAVDHNKFDLGRANVEAGKFRTGLQQATENVANMRETQKVTNVTIQKLTADLTDTTDIANGLKKTIDKQIVPDIQNLSDELSKTNLKMKHFDAELDIQKAAINIQKEEVSSTNQKLQKLRDDLSSSNTHVQLMNQRMAQLAQTLKQAKKDLEENTATTARLSEDHCHLSGNMHDAKQTQQRMLATVTQLQHGLDRASKDLHSTRGQLGSACSILDSTRQGLEQTKANVRSLREGHDMLSSRQRAVAGQLEQTHHMANETKHVLSSTNNLVLPNLHLDVNTAAFAGTIITPSSARNVPKKRLQ